MVATIREATQLLLDRFGGKRFQTIFIKPPWDYRESPVLSRKVGPLRTRPLGLSLPHLRSLPLYPLGQPSSWLFLYAPTGFLPEAVALMREWGFPYEAAIVWQDHWDEDPQARAARIAAERAQNDREKDSAKDSGQNGDDASEPLETAAPEHMTTKVTEHVAASEDIAEDQGDSEESEETEERDESPVNSARSGWQQMSNGKITGQKLHPKTAPQAFLLIGKRARRLGMTELPSPVFDKSALRINRLRFKGAPNLPSVQDLIEYCCPPSYLELFARSNRKGWSYWGFEAELIYPGWLEEGDDQAQDVLFELPDFFAKPAGPDHIVGITDRQESDSDSTPDDALDAAEMSLSPANLSDDELENAGEISGEISDGAMDSVDTEAGEELGLSAPASPLAELESEASLAFQRENQATSDAISANDAETETESEDENAAASPDLSLEDAYETAYEQVSADTSDAVRPPLGETVPYDDIVPLENLMNQEEEEGAETPETPETPDTPPKP